MSNSKNSSSMRIRKMTYAALYLAIALVLPFLTGQIPEIGSMLAPMHIPVFLCGFVCGWPWGMAIGLVAPMLRMLLFGMPPFITAIAMTFELATYGFISGVLYKMLPKKAWAIYASLIVAMIAGRIVWGVARLLIAGVMGTSFTMALFIAGALTSAVPGIILHLILIPTLVFAMQRAGLVVNK